MQPAETPDAIIKNKGQKWSHISPTLGIALVLLFSVIVGFFIWKSLLSLDDIQQNQVDGTTRYSVQSSSLPRTVTWNGKKCGVEYAIENPYKKGEYLISATRKCFDISDDPFLFIISTTTTTKIQIPAEYPIPYYFGSKYPEYVQFLSANELVYESFNGEGAECGAGGVLQYVKINTQTNAAEVVATGQENSGCHDADRASSSDAYYKNACWDSTNEYSFEGKTIIFSLTCQKPELPSPATFTIKRNNTVVHTENLAAESVLKFLGVQNTIALLQDKKDITYMLADKTYTVNIDTGNVSS